MLETGRATDDALLHEGGKESSSAPILIRPHFSLK